MKKRILSLLLAVCLVAGLLPAALAADSESLHAFTSSAGTIAGVVENGYAYDSNRDGIADAAVDLYTITVPFGVQADTLTFSEARVAYAYDENGSYLASCAADAVNGYGGGGQVGERTANVRLTSGQTLPAYVVVQTPYDESCSSETLYAVKYEYSYTFTASVNGVSMTEITAEPDAYSYYDYFTETTSTVMVYTVAVPEGTQRIDLTFSDNVLAYSYTRDGEYLAGWYSGDAMYTGGASASVSLDYGTESAPADGETDYIQIQSPYDAYWNSTFFYAITFDDGRGTGNRPSGPSSVAASLTELMEKIAAGYVDSSSEWVVMDMAAYANYAAASANVTSDAAKQAYINSAIESLQSGNAGDTAYDKAILALTGIGVDATQLYPVNSNTPINAIEGLNCVTQSTSAWSAPYTLAAYHQGNYAGTESYVASLVNALLAAQGDDGSWNEWGTIDTTGNAIAGLSFYADDPEVVAAIEKGVNYLASQMKDDGTFDGGYGSNANSCAMVIVGLCAAGVNPDTDARFVKDDVSALDGLLSFALSDNSGFGYMGNTTVNASATEQGFRALIAAAQVMSTGKAYNIYDFSSNTVAPGRATGTGSVVTPSEPDTDDMITVYFTLKSNDAYWIPRRAVTVKEGSTVYHAFVSACDAAGLTYVGAETGYVDSITNGSTTLGEFTLGENSGWLYKVNGVRPKVGLTGYTLAANDEIVWFYTEDWTLEPDTAVSEPEEPRAASFTDVSGHWAEEEILWAVEGGLMNGVTGSVFAPQRAATRGMAVTVLYRLAGSPAVTGAEGFTDVAEESAYHDAIVWAAANGIALGYDGGTFRPNAPVTRQQLAALLWRYARFTGCGLPAGDAALSAFGDAAGVSGYAVTGMTWAVASGLIQGSGSLLLPQNTATRAQLAVILYRFDAALTAA